MPTLYERYLGCLGILEEASPHVNEELREAIEVAFTDACAEHPLQWKRVLNRCVIGSTHDPQGNGS